ncbi:30S ribosomal protein S5 [Seleniivibrio woodruffii]|uniref:Small ribosomal subunit protein uS5 n=1 Tax=Seleniivibrio woodruffii TaxID=1078050 RepID=A0A4R1KCG4_9BACT|nr:30S ribosomal protein S5 [Seleniivibrio woodruffii]TCK62225.1 small subunit ribosomal protein S5 [Seleniivibrio woodruffii]TVZ34657.1 small subunit ribosomal protein S5 [Seleniivibrio woodruffii]
MNNANVNGENQLVDKVVNIGRVTKVVKGGRIFKFTALVVVGDMNGKVGIGHGKAREVPDAIKKALENAKKSMVEVPVVNGTIPHDVIGRFVSSEIVMKPAAAGTGIISGGVTRSLFELAGVQNILCKSTRSRNPYNSLYAVMDGFKNIRTLEKVAEMRGKTIQEIIKY